MEEKLPFKDPFGRVQPLKSESDVDFQDVFGGPPRRNSSIHERGRPRADSFDFLSSQRPDLLPPRRHWSGPGEKPAFGEGPTRNSSSLRRNFGDEFFNDIFPGSDSPGSTPKRVGTDVFSSNPGSCVHSPNGLSQTNYEQVSSSGSTLPAQTSLSLKFAKGQHRSDDALSESNSFPSSPSASVVSSTTNVRSDIHSLYRPSSSSRLASYATKNESKRSAASASMENYINSSNFHFSFYRWAGKGISLKFHNTSKEDDGESRSIMGLPEVVLQGVDLLTDNDDDSMSTATGASKGLIEMERMDEMNLDKMEEFEKESLHSDVTVGSGHSTQKEELQSIAESKSHSRKLMHLIMEDSGKSGHGFLDSQVEDNEVKAKLQHGTVPEDKLLAKKVKVKVRDFIKRFNSEVSPKRDQKMRKKDKNKIRGEGEVPLSPAVSESNGEEKSTESKIEEAFVFSSSQLSQVDDVQENVQEKNFESNGEEKATELKIEEAFFFGSVQLPQIHEVQQTVQAKVSDFSPESKRTVERTHEVHNESHVEDFEECLVEHSQASDTSMEQDQMKISESKVREWSRGKDGNIRSLLSTLQYVLWPGSGWKPVPLVSIIEAPAVKRAYQKALLCLHPDKLQQRGAALHEKYIAEKVFKILQEAWNEFTF